MCLSNGRRISIGVWATGAKKNLIDLPRTAEIGPARNSVVHVGAAGGDGVESVLPTRLGGNSRNALASAPRRRVRSPSLRLRQRTAEPILKGRPRCPLSPWSGPNLRDPRRLSNRFRRRRLSLLRRGTPLPTSQQARGRETSWKGWSLHASTHGLADGVVAADCGPSHARAFRVTLTRGKAAGSGVLRPGG